MSQQLLLPTPADPKLWVVRCGEGQEREAIVCLLQKCYDLANKGQPLLIKAAFCQDHLQVGSAAALQQLLLVRRCWALQRLRLVLAL